MALELELLRRFLSNLCSDHDQQRSELRDEHVCDLHAREDEQSEVVD